MKYLCIFQIGPVQEFINAARKAQDLWAGSFILSYLSSVAIATVEKEYRNSLIYPYLEGNQLFDIVKDNPDDVNSHDFTDISDKFIGTSPNRFVLIIENEDININSLLNKAKENIIKAYTSIAKKVKEDIEDKVNTLKCDSKWNEIWKRQVDDVFEIYWIASKIENEDNYGEEYKKAEALFGARKAIRNFNQSEEPGFKCTLCGIREQLTKKDFDTSWRGYTSFWKDIILGGLSATDLKYAFREGERLCAVCTTKRLAPKVFFKVPLFMPSTSSVATSSFLYKLAQLLSGGGNEIVKEFKERFDSLTLDLFPDKIMPLPKLQGEIDNNKMRDIFLLDGDAFIEDTYHIKVLKKYRKDKIEPDKESVEKVKKILKSMRELTEKEGIILSKYYALIMVDGDDIGKWLSGEKTGGLTISGHRDISRRLYEFSSNVVPYVSEKLHMAKIIYFGGDEGLIMCSLEDMLSVMRYLRAGYTGQLKYNSDSNMIVPDFEAEESSKIEIDLVDGDKFSSLTMGNNATLSMGVVIAHHQQSLLQVLDEVKAALKIAKMVTKKDAFCIATMKRSGGTTLAVSRWKGVYDNFDVIGYLMKMVRFYRQDLSDTWLYSLDESKESLIGLNYKAIEAETLRLIKRSINKEKDKNTGTLKGEIEKVLAITSSCLNKQTEIYFKNYLEMFINLQQVSAYIARGGGK